jgi:peptide/nickel transport system permease protein
MALADATPEVRTESTGIAALARMLYRDRLAFFATLFLVIIAFAAIFGPWLLGDAATKVNLKMRNLPPSLDQGFLYLLGADTLGRSLLARLVVGCQNTLGIAAAAVAGSMIVGGILGLIAGYFGGLLGNVIMRLADILMSFPSMLMAMVVLYALVDPRIRHR